MYGWQWQTYHRYQHSHCEAHQLILILDKLRQKSETVTDGMQNRNESRQQNGHCPSIRSMYHH